MMARRPSASHALMLTVGLVAGWALGWSRPAPILANGADRWGDRALASGPAAVEIDAQKQLHYQDALYYLNYSTGKLFASIPVTKQVGLQHQVVNEFAERDLIADFKIKPGANPHFLMTTARLGVHSMGEAPLYVFETESGQVGVYKITPAPQTVTNSNKPLFDLLDKWVDPRLGRAIASANSR